MVFHMPGYAAAGFRIMVSEWGASFRQPPRMAGAGCLSLAIRDARGPRLSGAEQDHGAAAWEY